MTAMPQDGSHTEAAQQTAEKYPVKTYQPEGGFTTGGLILMVVSVMIAGAVLGVIAYFVSKLIYLILLFPLIIGLGTGAVGNFAVKKGKIRNPMLGGVAGFFGGICAMFVMHFCSYQEFLTDPDITKLRDIFSHMSAAEQEEQLATVEPIHQQEARHVVNAAKSFIGYMDLVAFRGVEIKKAASSSSTKGINLGYTGSYIYFIIEILIVAGVTFFIVRKRASMPFCAKCDAWKSEKIIGWMSAQPVNSKIAFTSGTIDAIRQAGAKSTVGQVRVKAFFCSEHPEQCDVDLELEAITHNKNKVEYKTVGMLTWPGQAYESLISVFKESPSGENTPAPPKT